MNRFVLLTALCTAGVASAQVNVGPKTLTMGSTKFRRIDAPKVALGYVVLKKGSKVDFERVTDACSTAIPKSAPHSINVTKAQESEFSGSYKGFSGSATVKAFREAKLQLAELQLRERAWRSCVNSKPQLLKDLRNAEAAGNLRVVTYVWLVVTAEESNGLQSAISANVDLTIAGNGLSASVASAANRTVTVSAPAGATYAYELSSVRWSGGKKDERTVEGLDLDKVDALY